jgi:hypothetical protein
MEVARRTGDPKLVARVTVHMAQTAEAAGQFQKCIDLGREAQRLAREAGDSTSFNRIGAFIARSHIALGQGDEAITLYESMIASRLLFTGRAGEGISSIKLQLARAHAIRGEFGKAGQIVSEMGDSTVPTWFSSYFLDLQLGVYRDPVAQTAVLRERLIELGEDQLGTVRSNRVAPMCGFVAFILNDRDLAGQLRNAVERGLLLSRRRLPFRLDPLNQAFGWAVATQQDHAAVPAAYEHLLDRRGLADGFCGLSIDHTIAALAALMDDAATASRHFNDAVAFLRKAGYRPELGWALANFGDLEARTESADSARHAAILWDEALSIARELEMKPLVARMLARKKILKA